MIIPPGLKDLAEKIEKLKNSQKCKSCKLLYSKFVNECPHCHGIPGYKVKHAVSKRRQFRRDLGKLMIVGAVILILLLLLINF
jgi:hypothetical protein